MRQFHWLTGILAIFLLFIGITPCVSAFTLSSINVHPRGDQAAGTPVTVDATIDFSRGGTETFPQTSELQMSTNLVDPRWVPVLVLDGVETNVSQKTGESLIISGWYLSYPSTQEVQVKVTVTGTMPANPSSNLHFLKIQEVDFRYSVVSTTRVEMSASPNTTLFSPTKIPARETIFIPQPTETPTQRSPVGIEAGIIATMGAAFLVIKWK
jgi:hypothetical protein